MQGTEMGICTELHDHNASTILVAKATRNNRIIKTFFVKIKTVPIVAKATYCRKNTNAELKNKRPPKYLYWRAACRLNGDYNYTVTIIVQSLSAWRKQPFR